MILSLFDLNLFGIILFKFCLLDFLFFYFYLLNLLLLNLQFNWFFFCLIYVFMTSFCVNSLFLISICLIFCFVYSKYFLLFDHRLFAFFPIDKHFFNLLCSDFDPLDIYLCDFLLSDLRLFHSFLICLIFLVYFIWFLFFNLHLMT